MLLFNIYVTILSAEIYCVQKNNANMERAIGYSTFLAKETFAAGKRKHAHHQ